jgi:hypothetical protein
MRLSLALSVVFLALTACGSDSKKHRDVSNENYSYDYDVNGCKTGEHDFPSKEAYCKGLVDEELNHGCAFELREKTFANECR